MVPLGSGTAAGIHDAFDDGEEVEGRAGKAVNSGNRDDVAGHHLFQQPKQLSPVGVRTADLFTIDAGAAIRLQLLELNVERLPIGTDAGIAEAADFQVTFGQILRAL